MTNVTQGGCILQNSTRGLFESIVGQKFNGRGTISSLVIHRQRGQDRVLLVKTRAGQNWIFPQGGIVKGDNKPYDALVRNGFDQLGLKDSHVQQRQMLGEFINDMPRGRNSVHSRKHVIVAGVRVFSVNWVQPRGKKYEDGVLWVGDPDEFKELVSTNNRPDKIRAMCEAVDRAHTSGLLSWSCASRKTMH